MPSMSRFVVPGTWTTSPLSRALSDDSTTASADIQAISGRVLTSIPARSWNSVRVNPGHSAWTRTPVSRSSSEIRDSRLQVLDLLQARGLPWRRAVLLGFNEGVFPRQTGRNTT